MKIRITFKDPDGVDFSVDRSIRQQLGELENLHSDEREYLIEERREEAHEQLKRWIEFKEYLTVEFDLDKGTATVIGKGA